MRLQFQIAGTHRLAFRTPAARSYSTSARSFSGLPLKIADSPRSGLKQGGSSSGLSWPLGLLSLKVNISYVSIKVERVNILKYAYHRLFQWNRYTCFIYGTIFIFLFRTFAPDDVTVAQRIPEVGQRVGVWEGKRRRVHLENKPRGQGRGPLVHAQFLTGKL